MSIEELWQERNRIILQLRELLKLRTCGPHRIRSYVAKLLQKQERLGEVDSVLDSLFRRLNLVRKQLFCYYQRKYETLFKEAEKLHEDGPQILAEELLLAIDRINPNTSETGFRAYFHFYRKRAFSRIIDLLEDKGVHVSQARRSKLRNIKKEARKIYALEGRNLNEEDIRRITGDHHPEELLELVNIQRVDLFYEDEEGNCYERSADFLTPEKLLLLKEELAQRKGRESTEKENEFSTTKIFWWNWDNQSSARLAKLGD